MLGTLACLENHLRSVEKSDPDFALLDVIKKNLSYLWFWGESALPFFFNLIKFLELSSEEDMAGKLLETIFTAVVERNSPRSQEGIAFPYYGPNTILEALLETGDEKLDFGSFAGCSYSLEPSIHMLVRRGRRDVLANKWQSLSHIQLKVFRPDRIEDYFGWRVKEGADHGAFPNPTESWARLSTVACDISRIPTLLLERRNLLRFVILVYPHRADEITILALDPPKA